MDSESFLFQDEKDATLRQMNTPVFCSCIRRKDMDSVLNCLVTDSVAPGDYLERFLKIAKEISGYEYGSAVRSLWYALSMALDVLGLGEGSVVAVPALAPVFYLDVIEAKKMKPVYIDHHLSSGVVDVSSLASCEPKPVALLLYEALGNMPEPESMQSLGIPIIEDITTSFGAFSGGMKAGMIGQISIQGLDHGGLITSGGGALVFSHYKREGVAIKNRMDRVPSELIMTDYNAALGYAQMRDLQAIIEKRKSLYTQFAQSVARSKHSILNQPGDGEPGFWALPVSLVSGMKETRIYAKKKEIETEAAFDGSLVAANVIPDNICPNARSLYLRSVLFPVHQKIGSADAQKISRVLATLP